MMMDPVAVDASWLWKALNGLALGLFSVVGYAWKRLDTRVSDLEQTTASHDDIAELKQSIRDVGEKIERLNERNEDRSERLLTALLKLG